MYRAEFIWPPDELNWLGDLMAEIKKSLKTLIKFSRNPKSYNNFFLHIYKYIYKPECDVWYLSLKNRKAERKEQKQLCDTEGS